MTRRVGNSVCLRLGNTRSRSRTAGEGDCGYVLFDAEAAIQNLGDADGA